MIELLSAYDDNTIKATQNKFGSSWDSYWTWDKEHLTQHEACNLIMMGMNFNGLNHVARHEYIEKSKWLAEILVDEDVDVKEEIGGGE